VLLSGIRTSAQPPLPFQGFETVWFGATAVYKNDRFHQRFLTVEDGYEIIQMDFFPPETAPSCVWIESKLEPLQWGTPTTIVHVDYCGGIGWRHIILEPNFDIFYRWTLSIGLPGKDPTDVLIFYTRKIS